MQGSAVSLSPLKLSRIATYTCHLWRESVSSEPSPSVTTHFFIPQASHKYANAFANAHHEMVTSNKLQCLFNATTFPARLTCLKLCWIEDRESV